MTEMKWAGVIPAITTAFNDDLTIDHGFVTEHVAWLVDNGCQGIVACGSLGEGATLTVEEKIALLDTCVKSVGDRVPVVPGVAALSTADAVRLANGARDVGCRGLMALPPYVHKGPWNEIRGHFDAVIGATDLSCMLYNNPIAYGTDVTPSQITELAATHENLHAVKESSGDCRRITALRALIGDRLALFAGLDDIIVEAIAAGATGWIAGLVNALPKESVALFELARAGESEKAFELYRWFLPLLRLDTVPEFVQLIKLVQSKVGMGNELLRPPRRAVEGAQRDEAIAVIDKALATNPMA